MKQEINSEVEGGIAGRDLIDDHSAHHTTTIHVGHNSGQVSHGDIHNWGPIILNPSGKPKIKFIIQPGPDCIDEKQAATLKALVAEVAKLEKLLRRKPCGFGAVWARLTAKCQVTSYHLIPSEQYPKAEKFLREWIGRLSASPSAPASDPRWRSRRFSYIFTNLKKLNADAILRAQLLERFGSESMKDLSDEDLEWVYRLVAGWKKAGHAPGQA